MSIPVAILAGGLATRLRPITETIPKSLIDVAGRPFIERQLDLLRHNGIERVVLCIGYLGEMVRDVVGDGSRFGLRVDYSFDGPVLLGTGGSIKKALPLLGNEFFVMYGDSYLDVDFQAVYSAFTDSGKIALMTVFRNLGKWDSSNVLFVDGQVVTYSKHNATPEMQHIDFGLGVFSAEGFVNVPSDEAYDLADVYGGLVRNGDLSAFEVTQRFYEIGSPEGLQETQDYLASKEE